MMGTDTLAARVRSLRRSVGTSRLRTAIMAGVYTLYFPLLFGLMIIGPIVLLQATSLSLLQAAQYTMLFGAIGYLFGLLVLFR